MSKFFNIIYKIFFVLGLIYAILPTIIEIYMPSDIFINGLITQYQGFALLFVFALFLFRTLISASFKVKNFIFKIILSLGSILLTILITMLPFMVVILSYSDARVEYINNKKYIVEIELINFNKFKRHYYEEVNWFVMKKVDGENLEKSLKG